jgi:hypothetical protein
MFLIIKKKSSHHILSIFNQIHDIYKLNDKSSNGNYISGQQLSITNSANIADGRDWFDPYCLISDEKWQFPLK